MTRSITLAEAQSRAFTLEMIQHRLIFGGALKLGEDYGRLGDDRSVTTVVESDDAVDHDPVFVGFFAFMLACMIFGLLGFAVESRARDEEEIIELAPIEYAPKRAPMPERSIETQAISRAVSNAR